MNIDINIDRCSVLGCGQEAENTCGGIGCENQMCNIHSHVYNSCHYCSACQDVNNFFQPIDQMPDQYQETLPVDSLLLKTRKRKDAPGQELLVFKL